MLVDGRLTVVIKFARLRTKRFRLVCRRCGRALHHFKNHVRNGRRWGNVAHLYTFQRLALKGRAHSRNFTLICAACDFSVGLLRSCAKVRRKTYRQIQTGRRVSYVRLQKRLLNERVKKVARQKKVEKVARQLKPLPKQQRKQLVVRTRVKKPPPPRGMPKIRTQPQKKVHQVVPLKQQIALEPRKNNVLLVRNAVPQPHLLQTRVKKPLKQHQPPLVVPPKKRKLQKIEPL